MPSPHLLLHFGPSEAVGCKVKPLQGGRSVIAQVCKEVVKGQACSCC
jgi:hypothetical protein